MSERPERRNPDRQLFRDLVADMQALGDQVQRAVERMEDVAVIAQQVETNKEEIKALRLNTESLRERIAHMEGSQPATHPPRRDGFVVRPAHVTGLIGLVVAAVAGILTIIQHAIELLKSVIQHKP